MEENEFLLEDRLIKIKETYNQYKDNYEFILSFSGGRDSTVLHYLLDLALPNNNIKRIFIDTGIEFQAITSFVKKLQENDNRIIIIKPTKNIVDTLETYGYPFKSKRHSMILDTFHRSGKLRSVKRYIGEHENPFTDSYACPQKLKIQFKDDFKPNFNKKFW